MISVSKVNFKNSIIFTIILVWNPGLPLWNHTFSCKKLSFHEIFCIINVDLKPKRGASENDKTCAAYIPIFVSEFGKGSSAAFVTYRAIVLKYSGHAMWFWPVLGQHLWQLNRLAWKHKNFNATYLLFLLEGFKIASIT